MSFSLIALTELLDKVETTTDRDGAIEYRIRLTGPALENMKIAHKLETAQENRPRGPRLIGPAGLLKEELLPELCSLSQEVLLKRFGSEGMMADCFCENKPHLDPESYRYSEEILAFIQTAVRDALDGVPAVVVPMHHVNVGTVVRRRVLAGMSVEQVQEYLYNARVYPDRWSGSPDDDHKPERFTIEKLKSFLVDS